MRAKILLIEDDPFLHKLYLDMLTAEGYSVESSTRGDEALQKIKKGGWDLVLLDVMLPKMDGFAIMDALKKDSSFKKTFPIVYLSNLDNSAEVTKAKNKSDGYLIKSNMNPNEFLTEVKKYLT